MLLTRLAPTLLVMMLAVAPSLGVDGADVVARVSYEGNSNYLINVTFTRQLFKEFYQYMCTGQTASCEVKYSGNFEVKTINRVQSQEKPSSDCFLFQCFNSARSSSLACNRSTPRQSSCANLIKSSFINLQGTTACDATCVGLVWSLSQEGLHINSPELGARDCESQCCSTSSTSMPKLTTLLGSNQSTEANDVSKWWTDNSEAETSYTETIIISGVAAGIVFVALIVFFVMFLVKRTPTAAMTGWRNNLEPWFSSGNIIDEHKADNNQATKQNKRSDQNTITCQGNSKWAADFGVGGAFPGEDHCGRIEEPKELSPGDGRRGRYEEPKNNIQKPSEQKDTTIVDVGRNSCSEETEYALIDEAQILPDRPYYSSSDNDNDGYSSMDNLDYYNIAEAGSTSANGYSHPGSVDMNGEKQITSNFQELQSPRSRLAPPLTSSDNELSEYSVAKDINDDTDDGGNMRLAQGESPETSADTSLRDAETNERPHRLTLRSLQQLDKEGNMELSLGNKRNTYFELSKEGD